MSDPIIDTLVETGDVIEVKSQAELAEVIREDVEIALNLSYDKSDAIRTAINQRKFHDEFKPIKVNIPQTDIGIIEQPTFLSPPENGAMSKYAFAFKTSVFSDTHLNKDSHKQTTWQLALEPTFSSIKWQFTSLIFKTEIEIPEAELNFNTTYYVRVKYYGHKYQSEWSNPIRISTLDAYIEKPIFLSPTIDELISRQNAVLTASPFKTVPVNVTTQATAIWEVHRNSNFTDLVWHLETDVYLNQVTIPPGMLAFNGTFYARVRYRGIRGLSEWSNALKLNINYDIIKPIISTPVNGTEIKIYAVNISANGFVTDPPLVAAMEYSEWEVASDVTFTNLVFHQKKPGVATEITVPQEDLEYTNTYYARVRYWGDTAISPWSDTVTFTIAQIKINKPSIITPAEDDTISRLALRLITSSFVCDPPFTVEHKLTIFEIYSNINLLPINKVWEYVAATNLYNVQVPASVLNNDRTYYARVKYKSNLFESEWSDVREFKTFRLANILTPEYIKRETTSMNFGTDPERVIGHVMCQREQIDPYDSIIWGKWRIATDANFTQNVIEKIFSTDPDRLQINLGDLGDSFDPFLPNTTYYIKAAFKSLAASDFSAFTDSISITTGDVKLQNILQCTVINPDQSNNQLLITTDPFEGTLDYNEHMTRVQIVIASDIDFITVLETINIDNPSTEILSGQTPNIVGTIYVKIRFYGHYFGTTAFNDIITLNTGGIVKPVISTGAFEYAIIEDVVNMHFTLSSSEFELSQNRRDIHKKSNWIFYKDINKTQILHETGWIDALTSIDINISQEYIGNIYVGVKYRGVYFQESELSDLYLFTAEGFIHKPEISLPEAGDILLKTEVNLSCIPYNAQTGLNHTASSWKISSDSLGATIVWEDAHSLDLLSKTNVGSLITPGSDYYAWVKHESDSVESEWSNPVKFTIKATITKPIITNLNIGSVNNVNGSDLLVTTSAFDIDPVGYQSHMATLWEISTDEDFVDIIYSRNDTINLTSWTVPGIMLSPNTHYWIRVTYISPTLSSVKSDSVEIAVDNFTILEPGAISVLPSTTVGPDLSTSTITFADIQASNSADIDLSMIEIKYTDPTVRSTIYGTGEITRPNPLASLTYTLDQLPGLQDAFASSSSVMIYLKYHHGTLMSEWQIDANAVQITYTP